MRKSILNLAAVLAVVFIACFLVSCNSAGSPGASPRSGVFPGGLENASVRGGFLGLGESNGAGAALEATGPQGFGLGVSLKVYPVTPFSGELPKGPIPSGVDFGQHDDGNFTRGESNDEAMEAAVARQTAETGVVEFSRVPDSK